MKTTFIYFLTISVLLISCKEVNLDEAEVLVKNCNNEFVNSQQPFLTLSLGKELFEITRYGYGGGENIVNDIFISTSSFITNSFRKFEIKLIFSLDNSEILFKKGIYPFGNSKIPFDNGQPVKEGVEIYMSSWQNNNYLWTTTDGGQSDSYFEITDIQPADEEGLYLVTGNFSCTLYDIQTNQFQKITNACFRGKFPIHYKQ